MKLNILKQGLYATLGICLLMASCQKMDRPELGEILLDPEPPEYNLLKSWWSFENNADDAGENKLSYTASAGVTYVPGITGQAVNFNQTSYLRMNVKGDTVRYPNEYVSLPVDTLSQPGSLSISFWMNAPAPFTDGAQGIVALANKKTFWGHAAVFLENYEDVADPTKAYFKFHLFNNGVVKDSTEFFAEGPRMQITNVFGKWTHMVFVYDQASSSVDVYRDGVQVVTDYLVRSGTFGKLNFSDFNGIVWGTHQFMTTPSMTDSHGAEPWAKGFKGAIDQARIYTRALTAAEVTQLFTAKN